MIAERKNIDLIVHGVLVRSALNYRLRDHTSPTGTTLQGKPISCNGRQ
jgi:hypothetical protein